MEKAQFTIHELNSLLTDGCTKIISSIPTLTLKGEILDCRVFKRNCGISFRITDNDNSFSCKSWANSGLNPKIIKNFENTNCTIVGKLKVNYYYSHEFILEVHEITQDDDDSRIKKLKKLCIQNNYFQNKKVIDWSSIHNIGIASKINTQGYNDFIKQFKIPLNIILEEFTLEGDNTECTLISAIQNLQNKADVIIIIRGGGSTVDISNSFDTVPIFDAIKKSNIPIITAIGHEADKDEKLFITNVSDYDFPTPSTSAYEINKIFLSPFLNQLNEKKMKNENSFNRYVTNNKNKSFISLKESIDIYFKTLFGAPILKIESEQKHIIIQIGNSFYKQEIKLSHKMNNISQEDIDSKNNIYNYLDNKEIEPIHTYFDNITNNDIFALSSIIEYIISLNNYIDEFNNSKPKFLVKDIFNDTTDLESLIKTNRTILWCIDTLNSSNNKDEISQIISMLNTN